jgi:hypothetical protein
MYISVFALVGFMSHHESSVHGHESCKIYRIYQFCPSGNKSLNYEQETKANRMHKLSLTIILIKTLKVKN